VIGSGLCGSLSTGPFTATLDAGSISFASINATASNGNFSAQYNGLDVYAPWLDTHLKGDATLQSGGGKEASLGFTFTGSPVVSKTYGNLAFTARNLQFTQLAQQQSIWVVQTNTHFVFSAENKQFAAVDQIFYFGMNGRGYFAQGSQAQDVSLGGSSKLGQTPVDMVSVHLTTPASGGGRAAAGPLGAERVPAAARAGAERPIHAGGGDGAKVRHGGAASTLGKGEESSAETQAHDLSSRQKANRGGTKGAVGEVEGGEEVGGVSDLRAEHSSLAQMPFQKLQRPIPRLFRSHRIAPPRQGSPANKRRGERVRCRPLKPSKLGWEFSSPATCSQLRFLGGMATTICCLSSAKSSWRKLSPLAFCLRKLRPASPRTS
jgi:hypothetical protein